MNKASLGQLINELVKDNVIGLWTEIHFRTISEQDVKQHVFLDAEITEKLVDLFQVIISQSSGEKMK